MTRFMFSSCRNTAHFLRSQRVAYESKHSCFGTSIFGECVLCLEEEKIWNFVCGTKLCQQGFEITNSIALILVTGKDYGHFGT